MPRRELLTPAQRSELIAFPTDEGEFIRRYTFSKTDLAFIRQHRGDQNRLGVAVQMAYLLYPSRVLAEDERPHPPLLGMVAAQLRLSPSIWDLYAVRDQTRREHLQELVERLKLSARACASVSELIYWPAISMRRPERTPTTAS